MKAAYINAIGPVSNIIIGELPTPKPGPNQILVNVTCVTVDPVDCYIRSGQYPIPLPIPFIIGRDMCGIVVDYGTNVTKFAKGDKVWCNNQGYQGRQGTFAELITIDENMLYHLPAGISAENAVLSFHSSLTAVIGLYRVAQLNAGETIFVNGGAGNVGSAVVQIATSLGANVIATASGDDKIAWCYENGAKQVIDYKTQDVAAKIREYAPTGVDVYLDTTRNHNLKQALNLMAQNSRYILMSGIGNEAILPIGDLYTKDAAILGFAISNANHQDLAWAANLINQHLAEHTLQAKLSTIMDLDQAAAGHQLMEQGNLWGKILVKI